MKHYFITAILLSIIVCLSFILGYKFYEYRLIRENRDVGDVANFSYQDDEYVIYK